MYANLHNLYGTGIPVQTSRIEYISIIDQKKKIQITKGNAVKEFINGLIWFIYLTKYCFKLQWYKLINWVMLLS